MSNFVMVCEMVTYLFQQLLILFPAYPFIWAFAPMPEENIFSSPVQISCSTNTFYQESIQLTFEMTCLTHDDSSKNNASLIELFDGTHFVKMVKISTGNCTDEAELLLLSLKGQQSEKDDILEAVPAVTEDTIICLVIGPYPKIAKVSFQTACLDLQNITRNNSFSALNSEGTHNITINVKISSKDCKNSNSWLKSDDETIMETELDLVELTLDEANQQNLNRNKILTEDFMKADFQSQVEILEKQVEIVDFASNIEASLQLIQPAASIANFIFSFIFPSNLILITNLMQLRLSQINSKLDKLLSNLNHMETRIKSSIVGNTFISTYMDWEYAIRNGAVKLRDIRHQMGLTQDKRRQRNLALDYITYYNNNQIEGNIMNLHRVSVTANNPTNRNLFDLFIEHQSCDVTQLSGLMIILKNLMTSAAQQTMTYYYFKGEKTRSKSWYEKIKMYLFQMRQEFQKRIYFCIRNTIDNAKQEVEQSLGKASLPLPELFVQFILKKLSARFPWYTWGVVEFEQILSSSCNSELMKKGTNYFIKTDDQQKRNILVVWQDANQILNCTNISSMKTLVPYLRCDKCNENHVQASHNVLTKTLCPEALNLRCSRNNIKLTKGLQWDWIAVDGEAHGDRCQKPEACNNHGSCHSVLDTNQFMCICYPMYEGKTCDKRIVSNYEILSHLTTLRKTFMAANGVPTVVDIYFELQNGIKASLNEIKDALQYTHYLVKHSEILYQASYIANLYLDLKQGKMSLDAFGELLETFLQINSMHYIIFRLKGIILGEGMIDVKGEDIFNLFKKSYVSKFKNACTKTYATVVEKMKANLVYLDKAIGKALLMFKQWKIPKGDPYSFNSLGSFVDEFKTRQNSYHAYWKNTSCPSLTVPDLIENYCTEKLSFESMSVQLSCSDHKVPSPSSVQCVRREGQLVWSTTPKCNYQWAAWGSWSACSVTCGHGKKYRTRECMGHETSRCGSASRQEMICNRKKCCLSKDGNYECSIGQCIRQSQLCDGYKNCGNGEDESSLMCPKIIQSGDIIALKSSCTENHWLSCHCQVCPIWYKCKVSPCPGYETNPDQWSHKCPHEIFIIRSAKGGFIRHGDEIAIYSQQMAEWLSCEPGVGWCKTSPCIGTIDKPNLNFCPWEKFYIFSVARKSGCSLDTSSLCIENNIQHGDTVFIKSTVDHRQWLTVDSKFITISTCPRKDIFTGSCSCGSWKIYKLY